MELKVSRTVIPQHIVSTFLRIHYMELKGLLSVARSGATSVESITWS